MRSLIIITTTLLLLTPITAVSQQPNPYAKANDSWITISGTVKSAGPSSFELDYGKGTVTVEIDDWDWYAEGYKLLKGDKVRVYGFIDDDLYETTKIEASSVYVQNLGTYFFASGLDEEDPYVPYSFDLDPLTTVVTGTVTGVSGRTFTIDTGPRQLKVDTTGMANNPLDKEGFQQIKQGDRVSVTGRMVDTLFSKKELQATSVVTLVQQKKKQKKADKQG